MRGFTLVELLLVVAIIGIITALALPGLTAYRTKAANTAALSDIKNLALHELTWYADYQQYVSFTLADINSDGLMQTTITQGSNTYNISMVLSANVEAVANTDAGNGTVLVAAKCINGDRILGMEIEQDNLVRYTLSSAVPMNTTLVPASTTAQDLAAWVRW